MVQVSEVCPDRINQNLIGLAGKEMVRRAIRAIQRERLIFESKRKADKGGRPDFVTTADRAAQKIYVKLIKECFRGFGIVAEEDNLSLPCTLPGVEAFFTVDPLDGTKAFIRRQSHGVGTMISLVVNDQIVAAFVGDIMTGEIYYYRPGSTKVHRLFGFDEAEQLMIDAQLPLSEQYLLLRDLPTRCGTITRLMTGEESTGLFRDVEVTGGSIGIACARLWKGEVGGVVLNPTTDTPWDACPIWGISQKLGFVFINLCASCSISPLSPKPIKQSQERDTELLIIHESRTKEFQTFLKKPRQNWRYRR